MIHSSPEWLPVTGQIDTTGIGLAYRQGFAVAIVACSPLARVVTCPERGRQGTVPEIAAYLMRT